MLDKTYIRELLALLVQHLDELGALLNITLNEYRNDYIRRHAVEKLIELIVEYATDINRSIAESMGEPTPSTYYNTFEGVAKLKVISSSLSARLGATTGLRNRLVHGYETVDHAIVHRALKPFHRAYRQYATAIETYLSHH